MTIMATTTVNMTAFSKFPCRRIDISAIIQGIMLILSVSPSSWLIFVQGHSLFCIGMKIFIVVSVTAFLTKSHLRTQSIECVDSKCMWKFWPQDVPVKCWPLLYNVWLTHWKCGSNFKSIIFSCDQAALQMVFSVRLSICPSVTPFWLCFHHVPIIVSSWNFRELSPWTEVMSMQKVKVRGQRSRSQRSTPNLAVYGL